MKNRENRGKFFLLVAVFFFCGIFSSYAEEISYDKYCVPDYLECISEDVPYYVSVLNAPAIAVKVVEKSLRKAVVWLEDYHVYEKLRYVYNELSDRGFYLFKSDVGARHGFPEDIKTSYGIYNPHSDIATNSSPKFTSILYRKKYGRYEVYGWSQVSFDRYKDFGGSLKIDNALGAGNYLKFVGRYHDDPREDYFPNKSRYPSVADGASFSIEEASVSAMLGRKYGNWNFEGGVAFSTIDVIDAKDNDKKPITFYSDLKGLKGNNIFSIGLSAEHDTRDGKIRPVSGGYERFKLTFYTGTYGEDLLYGKANFDIARYFPLSEYLKFLYYDSVLAIRVAGEFTDDFASKNIPFFDLARLGGAQSLRGYQYNRFFAKNYIFYSIEYKYNIWGMKRYKVDASVFFDAGWSFDGMGNFDIDDEKESFGVGLRLYAPKFSAGIEVAGSSEGYEAYIRVNPVF